MPPNSTTIPVYLEVGQKRVFAGALDWPGWLVSGRDEASALQALFDAGARYAKVLRGTRLGFTAPKALDALNVVERVKGNTSTDFGAPNVPPSRDERLVDATELQRLETLLRASWRAFDAAAKGAVGKELRKGPRGGGRDLDGITRHVLSAEAGYLSALGWKFKHDEKGALGVEKRRTRAAIIAGLAASVRGEIPAIGPRGGQRWQPRYFVRRTVWHVIDHTWEIENRLREEEEA